MPAAGASADHGPIAAATDATDADDANREARRRVVMVGVLLVAGIALMGLALIVGTALWAGRLRRIARHGIEPAPTQDEFWYLRPTRERAGSERPTGSDDDHSPSASGQSP